jgi:hypothetical protein
MNDNDRSDASTPTPTTGNTCARCGPIAAELARTLEALADAREREAELLAALREWNSAAAAALGGRPEERL